jgi:hypothetical protein
MSRNTIDFSNVQFTEAYQDLSAIPLENDDQISDLGTIVPNELIELETEIQDNLDNPEKIVATQPTETKKPDNVYKALLEELAESNGVEIPKDLTVTNSDELLAALNELIAEPLAKQKIDERFKDANPYVKKFLDLREYFDEDVAALEIVDNLQSLSSLTDEDLQDEKVLEALYRDELTTVKRLKKEDIDELVEQAKTLNKLDVLGSKSKKNLEGFYSERIEAQKVIAEKKASETKNSKNAKFEEMLTHIDSLDSLGELKLSKELKEQAKKNLTTIVKNKNGKSYNDFAAKQLEFPNEINSMIEILNTIGVFNVDKKTGKLTPDFTKLRALEKKTLERKLDKLIQDDQSNGRVGTTDVIEGSISDRLAQLGY